MTIVIYHNPKCSTSRGVLEIVREAGHEPTVVEYLKTPPSRDELQSLVERSGGTAKDIVRKSESLFGELGLDRPGVSDAQLLDAMAQHPILINRPIVISGDQVKLCRPAESVKELL